METACISKVHSFFAVEIKNATLTSFLPETNDSRSNFARKSLAVSKLKSLVHQHKVVIFRNQGILSGDEQIQISRWFGEIEPAGFEQHPKSPDRRILRVSNDEVEGFRDFGTSGFHIDGSFMEMPNSFSIYHLVNKPDRGTTAFVDLQMVYSGLTEHEKLEWQRLWLLKTHKRIRGFTEKPGYVIHPLVYNHPVTGQKTLCIHQGKTSRFLRDWGLDIAKRKSKEETLFIQNTIDAALNANNAEYQYHHQWESGDLIISDNLAVAHMALPDTQLSPSEVGLRVMHRTVIKGTCRPWTDPRLCLQQFLSTANPENIDIDDVESEDLDMVKRYSFGNEEMLQMLFRRLNNA